MIVYEVLFLVAMLVINTVVITMNAMSLMFFSITGRSKQWGILGLVFGCVAVIMIGLELGKKIEAGSLPSPEQVHPSGIPELPEFDTNSWQPDLRYHAEL